MPPDERPLRIAVLLDHYPALSETFVINELRALRDLGHRLHVESGAPAGQPGPAAEGVPVTSLADDGLVRRLVDLVWVAGRFPRATLGDLRARRGWRREEHVRPLRVLAPQLRRIARRQDEVLHVHFAAGAALDALRIGRFLGVPYTLTAHAYDIYLRPRNLREKLRTARFSTSGCTYTVEDLRRIAGAGAPPVHRVVMGVDLERFERRTAPASEPHVLAVGRLVEKKGFATLVRAAALPAFRDVGGRVTIVGDGPLRPELAAEIEAHGLDGVVTLAGSRSPEEIRELLEEAAVLAMPCVVAADGDRDSMPVVVKEALAMEVPVVVSDEVGLPELVRPEFGLLVPPGDAAALSEALAAVLRQSVQQRAAMGRAGRAFVGEHAELRRESARLARLLREALDAGA